MHVERVAVVIGTTNLGLYKELKNTSLKNRRERMLEETKEFQKGYKTKFSLEVITVQIIRLLSMNFWWIVCAVTIILSSYFA